MSGGIKTLPLQERKIYLKKITANVTDMSNMHGELAKTSETRNPLPDSGLQQTPLHSHSYTVCQDSG